MGCSHSIASRTTQTIPAASDTDLYPTEGPVPIDARDKTPSPCACSSPPTDNFYSPVNLAFYASEPYESLDRFSRTIRLLAVTKDQSGKIRCGLRNSIPIADADGTYTVISYCAGNPKRTRVVYVNDKPFNAFANLAHAMEETYCYRSTEYGENESLLWVDRICINQSNTAERSHQVGFMYDIYRSARDVAVCLSTEEQRGATAIPWIYDMHKYFRALKLQHSGHLWHYLESYQLDDAFQSGWLDTLQMLEQPRWSRAWVRSIFTIFLRH
jgi:hypothetical protein